MDADKVHARNFVVFVRLEGACARCEKYSSEGFEWASVAGALPT
jgi:hypothetical protein